MKTYWIEDPKQLKLMASPLRLAILNSVECLGECSISDLAIELGIPADSLYYHIRMLLKAGLIVEKGIQKTSRRDEAIYSLPADIVRLRYKLDDPENLDMLSKVVRSMAKSAVENFEEFSKIENAVAEGDQRNLDAGQYRAWLSDKELAEINSLIARMNDIMENATKKEGKQLCEFTWVMSPLQARPKRRK